MEEEKKPKIQVQEFWIQVLIICIYLLIFTIFGVGFMFERKVVSQGEDCINFARGQFFAAYCGNHTYDDMCKLYCNSLALKPTYCEFVPTNVSRLLGVPLLRGNLTVQTNKS